MEQKTKVCLADDHQLVLDGLQLILATQPKIELVGIAHNGIEVLAILEEKDVDVLLLDINMPVLNGIETMKVIQKKYDSIHVIGLSMMDEINLIKQFIALGAKGFLLKNSGKDSIIKCIESVMGGNTFYDKDILDKLLNPKTNIKSPVALFPKLSRREKEILQLITDEHTTQEIADKLFISFGTVETHRRNIINKLGVRNTAGLVRVAMEYKLLE